MAMATAMATMTATTIRRQQWPAWWQQRQLGKSLVLAAAAVQRQQWQRQLHSGSMAKAAAAAAPQRRPAWRQSRQLGGSTTLVAAEARWEARRQGGGGDRVSGGDMT
jgi:hypothetical protein